MNKIVVYIKIAEDMFNVVLYAIKLGKFLNSEIVFLNIISKDLHNMKRKDGRISNTSNLKEIEAIDIFNKRLLRKIETLEKDLPTIHVKIKTGPVLKHTKEEVEHAGQAMFVVPGFKINGTILPVNDELNRVIKNIKAPTLMIPPMETFKGLKKMVLATNFRETSVKHILEMMKPFDLQKPLVIYGLHVSEKNNAKDDSVFEEIENQIHVRTGFENMYIVHYEEKDSLQAIVSFSKEINPDIIILWKDQISLSGLSLSKQNLGKIVTKTGKPIMVFQDKTFL